MRATVTVSLPEDLTITLDDWASKHGMSRSEVVKTSLKDFLYLQRFRELRQAALLKAQKVGIHTDEDVFRIVS